MPNKKKILFIITYLELGGAQTQLLSILGGLDKQSYDIWVYAGSGGYLTDKFLGLTSIKVKIDRFLGRKINPLKDIACFFRIRNFIKKNKFDIVHTHSPKASLIGRWAAYSAGIKNIVYTAHGWPFHRFMNRFSFYFYLFLERLTAKITKKIIVVSKNDLMAGVRRKVCAPYKFSLIHYGIDIDKFDNIAKERQKALPAKMVFTVSCLKRQKGLFSFLALAKTLLEKYPDWEFFIIGDGPLRKEITRKIASLGLNDKVRILGWQKNIDFYYQKASLFILTSLWEGLPVSVIEAAIAGVPLVVSDTGGVSDIIAINKQGLIVRPADIQELARASCKILKDYENWSKIVKNSRRQIDLSHWSYLRMLKDTVSLYEALG